MPDQDQSLAAPVTKVETVTVQGPKNEKFKVAANAMAARVHCQIVFAKTHELFEKTLDQHIKAGDTPELKEMKLIAETAKVLQEMSQGLYEKPITDTPAGNLGALAAEIAKAATQGAVRGALGKEGMSKLSKIKQLGRKEKVVDVVVDEVAPE